MKIIRFRVQSSIQEPFSPDQKERFKERISCYPTSLIKCIRWRTFYLDKLHPSDKMYSLEYILSAGELFIHWIKLSALISSRDKIFILCLRTIPTNKDVFPCGLLLCGESRS